MKSAPALDVNPHRLCETPSARGMVVNSMPILGDSSNLRATPCI